jgi:hypothetical protein
MNDTKEKYWNEEQLKLSDKICELHDEVSEQEDIIKEALAKINKANRIIRILDMRVIKLKTKEDA